MEMFMQIEKTLVSNKCLIMPQIFLQSEIEKSVASKLRDIVKRHQGQLVDSAEDATHIVGPMPQNTDEGKRTLLKNVTLSAKNSLMLGVHKAGFTERVTERVTNSFLSKE